MSGMETRKIAADGEINASKARTSQMISSEYPPTCMKEEMFHELYKRLDESFIFYNPKLLEKLKTPPPKYTCYPKIANWNPLSSYCYEEKIKEYDAAKKSLSLYCRIPDLQNKRFLYKSPLPSKQSSERQNLYVNTLIKEADLIAKFFKNPHPVRQIHFGGKGSIKLTERQFENIFEKIKRSFEIDSKSEISINVDPKNPLLQNNKEKILFLRNLGFNQIHLKTPNTLETQKENRKTELCKEFQEIYFLFRKEGFENINIHVAYGFPFQTAKTFEKTIRAISDLSPGRITLHAFSATNNSKNKDERNIFPSLKEKCHMYVQTQEELMKRDYLPISANHFSLTRDSMAQAYFEKRLHQNFQGCSIEYSEDFIGLGLAAMSYIQNSYFQNMQNLDEYKSALDQESFPIEKGKILSEEEKIRKWTITSLACQLKVDKKAFLDIFRKTFDEYFLKERPFLKDLEEKGLLHNDENYISITNDGKLFIYDISNAFADD